MDISADLVFRDSTLRFTLVENDKVIRDTKFVNLDNIVKLRNVKRILERSGVALSISILQQFVKNGGVYRVNIDR